MKKICKSLLTVALAVVILFLLCACGVSYHAAVYSDQADEIIREDFKTANRTGGVYIEGEDTVTGEEYPRTRAFIVDTQEAYDEIFHKNVQIPVDFETEMLVVCTFTSNYVRPVRIDRVKQNGDTLSVTLKEKRPTSIFLTVGAACAPYQRYVVLKMDRRSVTDVSLTVKD